MGKHKVTTKFISLNMGREVCYALTQRAEELGISRSMLITQILEAEMNAKNVTLTPENKAKCEAETAAERKARRQSWTHG